MASKKQLVDLDFGNDSRGTNHLDPVNPQDVATKHYVDGHSGLDPAAYLYAFYIS